jgi:AraC family transcriptional regulator
MRAWDIRGDLSFVHLYCTDEHLRRVGEQIWDRSPASFTLQEKTFSSDDKITAVYRQFFSITTGSSRRTS